MKKIISGGLALTAALLATGTQAQSAPAKPTIILVHGAFADSSSWNRVTTILQRDGYAVVAAPNPLRGVRADADVAADVVKSTDGPAVLVGHSYGGSVISEAAEGLPNVKGLVYVAAFAPDIGETALGLTDQFPGSTLGSALAPPVRLTDGGRNIPPVAMGFMAERAKSRQTVVVKGASHVVMVSHAPEVANLIERAAAAR